MVWVELGKELFLIGELVRSRELLQEAYKHAKILNEKEMIGEIHLFLGSICYLEGDYLESMENHMQSHKFIKDAQIWENSAVETFNTLKKMNKFDDIKSYLKRMIEVFNE